MTNIIEPVSSIGWSKSVVRNESEGSRRAQVRIEEVPAGVKVAVHNLIASTAEVDERTDVTQPKVDGTTVTAAAVPVQRLRSNQ